jgi:hypothetical protein
MNFSIVFNNTGDSILLESVNPAVLEYYVENLNNCNLNNFSISNANLATQLPILINDLKTTVTDCDWICKLIGEKIDLLPELDYLNQSVLNKMHADWVNSQSKEFNIKNAYQADPDSAILTQIHHNFSDDIVTTSNSTLLSSIGADQMYNKLNICIHNLENAFNTVRCSVTDMPWWSIDNPFEKTILTNNISNFRLIFNHPGRTSYNKFLHFDEHNEFNDENNFDQLLGHASFHLVKPQTIPLSKEYVSWCNLNNKTPVGDYLNIGNIPDLVENLTHYRKLFYRNVVNNTSFSIEI